MKWMIKKLICASIQQEILSFRKYVLPLDFWCPSQVQKSAQALRAEFRTAQFDSSNQASFAHLKEARTLSEARRI